MTTRAYVPAAVVVAGTLVSSRVLAATAPGGEGMGLLTILLLALGAIVILVQVIPAAMLLGSMLTALFSRARRAERARSADTPA